MTFAAKPLSNTLDLRSYRPGDEHAILRLFEASFQRPLAIEFWRWRYLENPAGGPWVELAWDGDQLAAHYALSASTLCVDGREVPAALSMTTMTHPNYRGRGLFPQLAERLYARFAAAAGGAAVYGFPNVSSHRGFVRDLAWRDIYEIPTLRVSTSSAAPAKESDRSLRVLDAPDERFDRLWERLRSRFSVWTCRDARHLAWRLNARSGNNYRLAAWHEDGEIRGYVAAKQYKHESLDIVDLVAETKQAARGLTEWAINEANAAHLPQAAVWCHPRAPWRMVLEDVGFQPGAPVTYMGVRVLAPAAARADDVSAWCFSMTDSDVY
jgi:GNAT superfamily N-acetyltransferase